MHQTTTQITKNAVDLGIVAETQRKLHGKPAVKVGTTNGRFVAHIRAEQKDEDGRVVDIEGTTIPLDEIHEHPLYNQHYKEV